MIHEDVVLGAADQPIFNQCQGGAFLNLAFFNES